MRVQYWPWIKASAKPRNYRVDMKFNYTVHKFLSRGKTCCMEKFNTILYRNVTHDISRSVSFRVLRTAGYGSNLLTASFLGENCYVTCPLLKPVTMGLDLHL